MIANENDIMHLEELYKGRKPFYGELHDHSRSGGTSDGKRPLSHWIGAMEALKLDFATILDHKQVRHMLLPEWQDGVFIGGSEPLAIISDSKATKPSVHFNMVFEKPEPLMKILEDFTELEFTGGYEGHFIYTSFSTERFCQLIDAVKAAGGFFVHPHPKQLMISDDPLDYWFRDETGIEVFYRDMARPYSQVNYELWTDLLAKGKRVWACAGGDGHACASDRAITIIYADKKSTKSYMDQLRVGDFICGSVGLRMTIGDTKMGSKGTFDGQRLVLGVGDFHHGVKIYGHKYRVDILDDKGVVFSHEVTDSEPAYFALDVSDDAKFYRAEVFNETMNLRISIGNPIWNAKFYE